MVVFPVPGYYAIYFSPLVGWMINGKGFERKCSWIVEILSRNFLGGTEENYEEPQNSRRPF
jgi:hypothetical protein